MTDFWSPGMKKSQYFWKCWTFWKNSDNFEQKYRQMLKTNTVKHNKDIVKYGQNVKHSNKYQ